MKILIVEDEDSLREVMIRSLEKERYVVESAANYQDALLKINDYDYDCIVLDIMLPGGSGLHLLEELKSAFDAAGLSIPYPQMEVTLRK